MDSKKLNKRGEVSDILIFVITLFILAVGFFVLIFITPQISNGLKTAGMNTTTEGINAIDKLDQFGSLINKGFLLIFIGLVISLIISSFLVRQHPIFLFLYIFFLAITVLLGFYLGNAYYNLEQNAIFSATLNNASYINWIMEHIAEIAVAVGAISMIVVFAKFSSFGGTQI